MKDDYKEKHSSNINASISTILGSETTLKRRKKNDDDRQKEIFERIITSLEETNVRAELLGMDMGLDFSKYDEQFYRAIDGLIELHFGKDAAELIFFYLYERIGEDGVENVLEDEDGNGIKTKEVSDEKSIGFPYQAPSKPLDSPILWTDVVKKLKTDYLWKEKFCRDKDVRSKAFDDQLQEFLNELELKEDFKEIRDVKSHFLHWFNKNRTKKTSFTDHDFKTIPFKKIV